MWNQYKSRWKGDQELKEKVAFINCVALGLLLLVMWFNILK